MVYIHASLAGSTNATCIENMYTLANSLDYMILNKRLCVHILYSITNVWVLPKHCRCIAITNSYWSFCDRTVGFIMACGTVKEQRSMIMLSGILTDIQIFMQTNIHTHSPGRMITVLKWYKKKHLVQNRQWWFTHMNHNTARVKPAVLY